MQNTTNKYGAIGTPTQTEVNADVPESLGVSALLVTPSCDCQTSQAPFGMDIVLDTNERK